MVVLKRGDKVIFKNNEGVVCAVLNKKKLVKFDSWGQYTSIKKDVDRYLELSKIKLILLEDKYLLGDICFKCGEAEEALEVNKEYLKSLGINKEKLLKTIKKCLKKEQV